MAFWDDLEKKATDATTNVMSRVKGVSDTTRLNSMVAEEEKRIKDIYFKIGQTYVALHGQENDAAFVNLLNALKASELKVEQYKQEIMDIKGVRRCEKCGAEVQNGAAFCMSCGTPLPRIQPQPVNVGRTCKKCGANWHQELVSVQIVEHLMRKKHQEVQAEILQEILQEALWVVLWGIHLEVQSL